MQKVLLYPAYYLQGRRQSPKRKNEWRFLKILGSHMRVFALMPKPPTIFFPRCCELLLICHDSKLAIWLRLLIARKRRPKSSSNLPWNTVTKITIQHSKNSRILSTRLVFCFVEVWYISPNGTVFENHRKSRILIASEARYVYNLNGQKFIKNAKNGPFLKLVVKQCYQTGHF